MFDPFPNEINFTKLKYNEKNGILNEYMTQLHNPLFIPEFVPAIDIFKLSCLNKEFRCCIEGMICPLTYDDLRRFQAITDCVRCLKTTPDISKFYDLAILKER